MKKVGIATFHYADNYGAVLQAYALRKAINRIGGYRAELINYVPKGYSYPVNNDKAYLDKVRKRKKIENFLIDYCNLRGNIVNGIYGNEYDIYVAGSDQVWNMDIPEAYQDKEYFFPHVSGEAKCIAYAASIGNDLIDIDENLFKNQLSKFSFISVREYSYLDIVSRLSGKHCEQAIDPTLLLCSSDYEKILKAPQIAPKDFLLFFWYALDDTKIYVIEYINRIARKTGLNVFHTLEYDYSLAKRLIINRDGSIMDSGIEEFLWFVKNASFVITDSYHCMIFALLFERPLRILYSTTRQSRQRDFIKMFGLEDLVLDIEDEFDEICVVESQRIFEEKLIKERLRSENILKQALETCNYE